MAKPDFPESFKDPLYASLDAKTESKLGLPSGLLSSIRLNGERSNHSATNSLNTATVYQFTPTTAKLIENKYGIDPKLSPENASEAAGLLLKEGLDRNKGDAAQAVGEYIGGTDRANWGKTTNAYIGRVMGGIPAAAPSTDMPARPAPGQSTFDKVMASMTTPTAPAMATVLKAYQSGQMSPEDAKAFEASVNDGHVMLPQGASLNPPSPNWGNRPDGTAKGNGFLGVLPRPDGGVSTEISIGVNIGGKDIDIPTLVPTLTQAERDQLLSLKDDQKMPESIVQKAVDHAKSRIAQGLPVFAGPGESPRKGAGVPPAMPDALAKAYQSGSMDPADKAQLDDLIKQGVVAAPKGASQIPGQTEGAPSNVSQKQAAPTVGQQIVGAGEAALNAGTGLVGGTVGSALGAGAGLYDALTNPNPTNTNQAFQTMSQGAEQGAQALTYAPRTAAGQNQAQAVGDVMANAAPLMGHGGELAAIGELAKPTAQVIAPVVRDTVGQAAQNVATGVRNVIPDAVANIPSQVGAKVGEMMGREPAPTPTPGTMGSVGAMGVDMATQRRMNAADLPAPIELTKGQAERSFEQQRFERETAKNPDAGAPLRERFADQNQQVLRNFDAWVDQTGAEAPDLRATGVAVDKALVQKAARDKAEIRVAYKNAEKAGEMAAPVSSSAVADVLNASKSAESTAPVLSAAKAELQRLGGGTLDEAGNLVGGDMTLGNMEQLRKFVNKVSGVDPTNQKFAADIKSTIDASTEGAGGDLYRSARRLRENYANQYENRAVIAKLLNTKRGTNDRNVAFEDVFNHAVLSGSLDDVRTVRKVLQTGGDDGKQAWKELQGQTVNYIKDQATKNVARDERGNAIVSASGLDKAVRSLDSDGKLDFVFGKKGAEQIRAINDLAKDIYTAPPGSVNTSNTAAVLTAALDMAISGAGGMPLPVATGLRMVVNNVKDRRIQAKVNEALGLAKRKEEARPRPIPMKKTIH